METPLPNYDGRMTQEQLAKYLNPVWIVKGEDEDYPEEGLAARFGGYPYHKFADFEDVRRDLNKAKNNLRAKKLKDDKADDKMIQISCGNFIPRMLPPDFQYRRYYCFPWMEAIIPIVDTVVFDGKCYEVMVAFPNDGSVQMAVTDAVKTTEKEDKVFITALQVAGSKKGYADEVIRMGKDHRVDSYIITNAVKMIGESRGENGEHSMDLVLYVSERVRKKMSRIDAANLQLVEGYEAILLGLYFLKEGGTLITQTFHLDNSNWLPLLYIMSCVFRKVSIRKPVASVRHSGEVFIEAVGFERSDVSVTMFCRMNLYNDLKYSRSLAMRGLPLLDPSALPQDFLQNSMDAIITIMLWRTQFIRRGLGILSVPDHATAIFADLDKWKVLVATEWYRKWQITERLGLPICEGVPFILKWELMLKNGIAIEVDDFYKINKRGMDDDMAEEDDSDGNTIEAPIIDQTQEPGIIIMDLLIHQQDDEDRQSMKLAGHLFHRVFFNDLKGNEYPKMIGHMAVTRQFSEDLVTRQLSWTIGGKGEPVDVLIGKVRTGVKQLSGTMQLVCAEMIPIIKKQLAVVEIGGSLYLKGIDVDRYSWTAVLKILGYIFQAVVLVSSEEDNQVQGVVFWQRNAKSGDQLMKDLGEAFNQWEYLLRKINGAKYPNAVRTGGDPSYFLDTLTAFRFVHRDGIYERMEEDESEIEEIMTDYEETESDYYY